MVADLLRLLPKDLTEGLDLETLHRLPAGHVGEALHSRRSDLPWRIEFPPHDGRWAGGGSGPRPRADDSSMTGAFPRGPSSPLPLAPEHPEACLLLIEFQSTVRFAHGRKDAGAYVGRSITLAD